MALHALQIVVDLEIVVIIMRSRITNRLSTLFWIPLNYKSSGLWNVISVVGWLKQSVSHLSRHEGEGSGRCSFFDETRC